MKVKVDAQQLKHACLVASKVITRNTSLPATKFIQIKAESGTIFLRCTNLEQMVWYKLEGEIEESGEISVIHKLMNQFLKREKGKIVVGTDPERGAYITGTEHGGISTLHMETLPNDQHIPDVKVEGYECNLGQQFTQSFVRASVCVALEENRPILNGINLEPIENGTKLAIASADGFRLYVHHLPLSFPDKRVVVPAKVIASILPMLAGNSEITCCINENNSLISFTTNGHQIVSQLIQGTFPQYPQLIPTDTADWSFECSPHLLQIRANQLIYPTGIMRLRCNGDNSKLFTSIGSSNILEDGVLESEIPAKISGNHKGKIAVNQQYISDALNYFSSVKVEMTSPSSPLVFTGDIEDLTIVVMPMFVQW